MSAAPQQIVIVDLGMGNLRSVQRATLQAAADAGVGCSATISGDPEAIVRADKVVMPGQGAFRDCAAAVAGPLGEALREVLRRGTPYLGICLGLQVLFESSEEAPGAAGLGVFRGAVKRLPDGAIDPTTGGAVKVPHMGWNEVELVRQGAGALGAFDGKMPYFYFVHSFHAAPEDPSVIAGVTRHGPHRITAAVQRDNVTATQFHPEKSQGDGLLLLAAFLRGG